MRTVYRKRFLKEPAKLPPQVRSRVESFAFEELPAADSLAALGKVEKMRGYPGCYKVRFGSHRVGLILRDDAVTFERVLDRKEIYRHFP
jgi:mRNA interferase RelE/StbE